jgi:hypothetical protein
LAPVQQREALDRQDDNTLQANYVRRKLKVARQRAEQQRATNEVAKEGSKVRDFAYAGSSRFSSDQFGRLQRRQLTQEEQLQAQAHLAWARETLQTLQTRVRADEAFHATNPDWQQEPPRPPSRRGSDMGRARFGEHQGDTSGRFPIGQIDEASSSGQEAEEPCGQARSREDRIAEQRAKLEKLEVVRRPTNDNIPGQGRER